MKDEAYIVLIMRPPEPGEPTITPGWFLSGWAAIFATSFAVAKKFVEAQYDPKPQWHGLKNGVGVYADLPSGEILQVLKGPIYLPEAEGDRMRILSKEEKKLQ